SRHDHLVQRVAGGHPDRAGCSSGAPRDGALRLLRRLLGAPGRGGVERLPLAHLVLGEPLPQRVRPVAPPYAWAVTAPTIRAPLARLPNALTIGRLLVIPVFVGLVLASDRGTSWAAAILFGAAAVTDQIDGFLARRWHVESAFGKIADPLADRLLIDAAVILLWHAGRLPWVALLIPARDVFLMAATPFAIGRGYRFEVNLLGKIATWGL